MDSEPKESNIFSRLLNRFRKPETRLTAQTPAIPESDPSITTQVEALNAGENIELTSIQEGDTIVFQFPDQDPTKHTTLHIHVTETGKSRNNASGKTYGYVNGIANDSKGILIDTNVVLSGSTVGGSLLKQGVISVGLQPSIEFFDPRLGRLAWQTPNAVAIQIYKVKE